MQVYKKFPLDISVLPVCIFTLAFVLIYFLGDTFVRIAPGIPILFFVPGYVLLAALFPKKENLKTAVLNSLLILVIIFSISMVYFVIAIPKTGEKYTEFYILDPSGKADHYPTDLIYNSTATVLVGVANHEYDSVNYTVQIALDKDILADEELTLNHSEIWEKNITFEPDKQVNDVKLELWLFKENNFTAPYRELYLQVNVT